MLDNFFHWRPDTFEEKSQDDNRENPLIEQPQWSHKKIAGAEPSNVKHIIKDNATLYHVCHFFKKEVVSRFRIKKTKKMEVPDSIPSLRPGEMSSSEIGIKLVRNNCLVSSEKVKNHALGRSIYLLKEGMIDSREKNNSRSLLDDFFSSRDAQKIFLDNDFAVNIDSTLEFIDLYKEAISIEQKKTEKSNRQLIVCENRLAALSEIKKFVESLRADDSDCAALCRFAIQLCGRCREPKQVKQLDLPFCGINAILAAGWRIDSETLTRVSLKVMTYYKVKLPGSFFMENSLPYNTDYTKYSDALADKVLMSLFVDLATKGTYILEDKYIADELGLPTKMPVLKMKDDQIIEGLRMIGKKYPVSINTQLELNFISNKNSIYHGERKSSDCFVIEDDIDLMLSQSTHMVLIENFSVVCKRGIKYFDFKLFSWGCTEKISMPIDLFKRYFNLGSCLLIGENSTEDTTGGIFS